MTSKESNQPPDEALEQWFANFERSHGKPLPPEPQAHSWEATDLLSHLGLYFWRLFSHAECGPRNLTEKKLCCDSLE